MAEVNPTVHRPAAADLDGLARHAVQGHAAIAKAVRDHAARVAAERAAHRAAAGAERAAAAVLETGASDGKANPDRS